MKKKVAALGLDIGKKRIGIAGCDGTGLIATGLTTLHRTNFAEDVRKLQAIITEREVDLLVVGMPYSLDGSVGTQANKVAKIAKKMAQALNLPLEYVDERLTSVEAEDMLKAKKKYSSYDKGAVDRQAATIILQQWLDMRRNNLAQLSPTAEK